MAPGLYRLLVAPKTIHSGAAFLVRVDERKEVDGSPLLTRNSEFKGVQLVLVVQAQFIERLYLFVFFLRNILYFSFLLLLLAWHVPKL